MERGHDIVTGEILGTGTTEVPYSLPRSYLHTHYNKILLRFRHSVNNRPVKRLTLVARLPPAFYIGPHAVWNYGIVTPFS